MTNNYDLIVPLLDWRSEDDFYFLQILQRKKDHAKGKVNGVNNNSRLVKAYYLRSAGHLEFIMPEVIELCEIFNARAGINLNRRSFEKMALQHLKKVTDQIINGDHRKAYKAYSSVVGAFAQESDKKWILDVDEPFYGSVDDGAKGIGMLMYINTECKPYGEKFIESIPSKNGYHLITKPFDLSGFRSEFPDVEVHKNNPTNLYIS